MGLLWKKRIKEDRKDERMISGNDLVKILSLAINAAIEEISEGYYTFGPEVMFECAGNVHFMGVKYDKKKAEKEGKTGYWKEYMTLYLDKNFFDSKEEFYEMAVLDGKKLKDIPNEILVGEEFAEIL